MIGEKAVLIPASDGRLMAFETIGAPPRDVIKEEYYSKQLKKYFEDSYQVSSEPDNDDGIQTKQQARAEAIGGRVMSLFLPFSTARQRIASFGATGEKICATSLTYRTDGAEDITGTYLDIIALDTREGHIEGEFEKLAAGLLYLALLDIEYEPLATISTDISSESPDVAWYESVGFVDLLQVNNNGPVYGGDTHLIATSGPYVMQNLEQRYPEIAKLRA